MPQYNECLWDGSAAGPDVPYEEYAGGGGTGPFVVGFPYQHEDDVVVFIEAPAGTYTKLNGANESSPGFSFGVNSSNENVITLTTATSGQVHIVRVTELCENEAEFEPGASVRAEDLNATFTQMRHAIIENREILRKMEGGGDIVDPPSVRLVGGDGIDITSTLTEQTISVDLASNPGLEFDSGELRVDTHQGLERTANGLSADLGNGLEFDGSNQIQADLGSGLEYNGSDIQIDQGEGLEFNGNELRVHLDDTDAEVGLEFDGDELRVKAASTTERGGIRVGNTLTLTSGDILNVSSQVTGGVQFKGTIDLRAAPGEPTTPEIKRGDLYINSNGTSGAPSSGWADLIDGLATTDTVDAGDLIIAKADSGSSGTSLGTDGWSYIPVGAQTLWETNAQSGGPLDGTVLRPKTSGNHAWLQSTAGVGGTQGDPNIELNSTGSASFAGNVATGNGLFTTGKPGAQINADGQISSSRVVSGAAQDGIYIQTAPDDATAKTKVFNVKTDGSAKFDGAVDSKSGFRVFNDTTQVGSYTWQGNTTNGNGQLVLNQLGAGAGAGTAGDLFRIEDDGASVINFRGDGSSFFKGPMEITEATSPWFQFGYGTSGSGTHRLQWDGGGILLSADPGKQATNSRISFSVDGTTTGVFADDGSLRVGGTLPNSPKITLKKDGSSTFNGYGRFIVKDDTATAAVLGADANKALGTAVGGLRYNAGGQLVIYEGAASVGNERIELNANGTSSFAGKITLIGTGSVAGIQFGSTDNPPASGGIDISSQTLDDYEEGTWTPTSSQGTLTFDRANYTKVGRQVTVSGRILTLSDTSTASDIKINGLPFASVDNTITVSALSHQRTGKTCVVGSLGGNTSGFDLVTTDGGGAATKVEHSDLSSNDVNLVFTFTYPAS